MSAALRLHQSDAVALVDAEDLPELARWRWHLLNGYVVRKVRTGPDRTVLIYLHRWLMQATPAEVVDHVNGDRLDNRRSCNLRRCSQSENLANRAAPMPHGYRGVYPEKNGTWRAQIKVQGKSRRLGTFPAPEAAARAYDVAALAAFGRFARLNFPGETVAQLPLALPVELDLAAAGPAPALPMDWAEIQAARRAHTFTGAGLAELDTSDCLIPF